MLCSIRSRPACTAARKVCVMDDWTSCEQDDDCIDIHYACTGATVNKRFAEVAAKFYAGKNATLNCTAPVVDEKKCHPLRFFAKRKNVPNKVKNPFPIF